MAGPVPMALGQFNFEALPFGFESQDRVTDTPWAEINTAYREDELQWTGPKSTSFDISGVLFPHAFGGLDTLEGLRAAAKAGQKLRLVTGAGGIHGMHVIQSISEGRTMVDYSGLPHRCEYSISLFAYHARGGLGIISQVVNLI